MTGTFHIVLAMKPLDGNFAQNALRHGVAGINVDGCRVVVDKESEPRKRWDEPSGQKLYSGETWENRIAYRAVGKNKAIGEFHGEGRWPANVIHDGSDGVVGMFPEMAGSNSLDRGRNRSKGIFGELATGASHDTRASGGSAARFFYRVKELES